MRRLQWESSCHRSRGSRAGRLSAYPREVIFPQSQLLEPLREQLGRRNFVGVELCEKHLVYCVRFEHVIHEAAARCEPASELEVATDDRLGERAPHFRYEAAPGACHIWQMLVPQMSATRAPIARRADALSCAGLCVWSLSWQRILPSHPASASISDVATAVPSASSGYCARVPMRAASFSSSVSSPIA